MLFHVVASLRKQQEWCFQCLAQLLLPVYLLYQVLLNRRLSIVKEIVLVYAHLAKVVVKENAKDAKVVVKMDARQHVEVDVAKVAKVDVMPCAKVTVQLDAKSLVIVFAVNLVLQDVAVVVVALALVVVVMDALAIVVANAMEHAVGLVDMAVLVVVLVEQHSRYIDER